MLQTLISPISVSLIRISRFVSKNALYYYYYYSNVIVSKMNH